MIKQIDGCIFDLDGVIVNTAKFHFMGWKRLADQIGIKFTEKDNERLKGVSRMESLDIILGIGKRRANARQREEYAALKNDWYVGFISKMTHDDILPGCLEFIKELKNAGIRVAIGSASKNTPLILERTGIKELFDAVADGNIVSKAKPDPEVFLKAAELMAVDPKKCIVFEDAIAGVQAAINAGMVCIGIGSGEVLSNANYVISGLNEINLEKLNMILKEL
jgi:beta-phosphoglucomutase